MSYSKRGNQWTWRMTESDCGMSGWAGRTGVSWPICTPHHPMVDGGHHGRPTCRGRAVWRDPRTVNVPRYATLAEGRGDGWAGSAT